MSRTARSAQATTTTSKTVSPTFFGSYTGSAILAAYGIGMATGDTSSTDSFLNLENDGPLNPPDNRVFTINGTTRSVASSRVSKNWGSMTHSSC